MPSHGLANSAHQDTTPLSAADNAAQHASRRRPVQVLCSGEHPSLLKDDSTHSTALVIEYGPGRLYWWDEAPAVLKYNKYIRSGYRAGLSYPQCVCSMVQYHNEIGNIWSHLIPVLYVCTTLALGYIQPWAGREWAYYLNVGPVMLCLTGSVCYHTFMAHHPHYRTWLAIDVCGVFLILMACPHLLISWGFACQPMLVKPLLVIYYSIGGAAAVGSLRGHSPWMRAVPMLLLFAARVVCLAMRYQLQLGSMTAVQHYVLSEVWVIVGGAINAARVPEKWLVKPIQPGEKRSPGLFDYWCNSHQIMHCLVLISIWHMHSGAYHDYLHMRQGSCS